MRFESLGPLVLWLSAFLLVSCQTASEKAEVDLQKTLIHFSSLNSRVEKTCLIEVHLSAPTQAKYQQSYPDQFQEVSESQNLIWKISSRRCELQFTSDTDSGWKANHLQILNGAFCSLLMGFQVQSPFSGVEWLQLKKSFHEKNKTFLWTSPAPGIKEVQLGLDPVQLKVQSEKGTQFFGEYTLASSFPHLSFIQRESGSSGLRVNATQFQELSKGQIQTVFPRELEKIDLFIRDENFKEFQYYGQAKILRCES